jgi:hypothetical protein
MNFTQAVSEVVGITKRPDKLSDARREVNSAISFYCLDNTFANDFVEQSVALDATQYDQSFSKTLLTRFRTFKYIKRGGTSEYLTRLSDQELGKKMDKCDKFYEVGTNVNISMRKLAATLDVGYWAYPPLLTDELNNNAFWMLDLAPYMIIDRAAAAIFRSIGDEKSFQTQRSSAIEAYMAFRKDMISHS